MSGSFLERVAEQIERLLILVRVAQQLRLGLRQLHALLVVLRAHLLQVLARIGEPALFRQHAGITHLGVDVLFSRRDRAIPLERLVEPLPLFIDLAEVEAHRVRILVIGLERVLAAALSAAS